MTRRTNARIAGIAFVFYIAVALTSMVFDARATRGADVGARLATLAEHTTDATIGIVFGLLAGLSAIVLAVTMRAITRDEDPDIATFGFAFRLLEGLLGFLPIPTLALLWLAGHRTVLLAPVGVDAAGDFLFALGTWQVIIASLLFAIGSTAFAWLLVRGRIVPRWIAWPGLAGSVLIAVALAAQLVGVRGPWIIPVLWGVLLVYELVLAWWLIVKGATMPVR